MHTTIQFNPDGTAQCLWANVFPLRTLGRLQITRATNGALASLGVAGNEILNVVLPISHQTTF